MPGKECIALKGYTCKTLSHFAPPRDHGYTKITKVAGLQFKKAVNNLGKNHPSRGRAFKD